VWFYIKSFMKSSSMVQRLRPLDVRLKSEWGTDLGPGLVMKPAVTPSRKFFIRRTQTGTAFQNFFPGGITITPLSPTEFCFPTEHFLKEK
jgi:hypothetical protein